MCSETLGLHSQEQKQTQAKLESYIMQYTLDSHSEKTSEERRNLLKCCLPLLKQATWWHQWRRLPLKYNPVGKPNFFFFFGAEQGLLQGPARRCVAHALKSS